MPRGRGGGEEVGGGFLRRWGRRDSTKNGRKIFFTHFPLDLEEEEEEYKYLNVLNERFSLKGEETLGALEM